MKNILKVAAAAAFIAVPMQASAVTDVVPFNGTVTHTCTISGITTGTMAAAADFQSMSSTTGSSGSADVVATSGEFDLSITSPGAFVTQPVADTTDESFSSSYTASGATTGSGSAGDAATSGTTALSAGTTNVSVDLTATKSGTDIFETGSYTAQVTVRCE